MPQMYPLMWTTLYMYFTISLMFFLTMIFFMKVKQPFMKHHLKSQKPLFWQW